MSYTYANCPYCDKETEINYEGSEDGQEFETQCSNCGKEFSCNIEFEAIANCTQLNTNWWKNE